MAAVTSKKRIRLGDLLVSRKLITENQLEQALEEQKLTGRKLGQTLIRLDMVGENDVLALLSEQLEIPFIELKQFRFDSNLVQQLPEVLARRFRVIILREDNDGFLLGMVDPTDIFCIDELTRLLKKPLKLAVVRESELLDILGIAYSGEQDIASLAGELEDELTESGTAIDLATIGA
ncbi:MAG: MSHA biogenesis protein MshE, partial [Gammaproteobacteria bacterium]|nr:MSHA biogenesis protein MshE [Gammaproteobacteria bacterium]